jgi:nitrogen fixation protein NifB
VNPTRSPLEAAQRALEWSVQCLAAVTTHLPIHGSAPLAASNCGFARGCGDAPSTPLPPDALERARNHPCYSEEAHHHFARMHVAVAPACNIQCHYCNRKFDCSNESRPGVVSERLTPEQAVRKVLAVAAEVPSLSVVGIAGPGDPLANPLQTFATLEAIRRAAPDLKLCLSTNGLALLDHVERLAATGVHHLTVTINAVDPGIGARIYSWITWEGRRLHGVEAARILIDRQLAGLARAVELGILCKVNSVVVPGVNDRHLPEVARRVKAMGVFLHNVMPLLSAPEHGTHFGLTGQRGPTPEELESVQRACEVDVKLMRHCRQCRADAVGRLGEDRNQAFSLARLPPGPAQDASDVRAAHRDAVERTRRRLDDARREALRLVATVPATLSARVAVATKGDGLVNQHFGHAREFLIYDVDRAGPRLVSHRKVEQYCVGGDGEDDVLADVLRTLSDCDAVLAAKLGHCPRGQLTAAGIEPVTDHAFEPIEAALCGWLARLSARVAAGELAPPGRRAPPSGAPAGATPSESRVA